MKRAISGIVALVLLTTSADDQFVSPAACVNTDTVTQAANRVYAVAPQVKVGQVQTQGK